MLLSSATQPLGCHPREFGAFYSPSTPPFSLFLSRSRLGRTEREPRTDRALGLFSSVAEVPHGRPLDPPSHARPIPRNRALPHARPAKLRLRGLHAMAGSSSPWRGSSASTPAMDHTTATTPTRRRRRSVQRRRSGGGERVAAGGRWTGRWGHRTSLCSSRFRPRSVLAPMGLLNQNELEENLVSLVGAVVVPEF